MACTYEPLLWVFDGQIVWAPVRLEGKPYYLRCVVLVACGNTCRVVNEKYNLDRWYDVQYLYRDEPDPPPKDREPVPLKEAA